MIGLSNQALSLVATSPLLGVFEDLPIRIDFFAGLSVNCLEKDLSNGVKVTTTRMDSVSL